jgi:anti-sigma factor RsiW
MSISEGDWELLHREIDGENSPEVSARLKERLSREPELDACYRALLGVGRSLSEVGLVAPPEGIVGDVMQRVRPGLPVRPWRGGLTGWVARQPGLALAASLAVGVLAGVLATGARESGRADQASVSATALPSARLQALPVVDETHFEGSGIEARVVAHRKGDVVIAEVEIRAGGPVDLTVGSRGGPLRPSGFESADGRPVGRVVLDATGLHAQGLTPGRYLLVLQAVGASPAGLQLRLESPQGVLEGHLSSGEAS